MPSVGRYRLLEELGRGAMGSVHRGLDPEGRRVAVKLLHGAFGDERRRRRFETEVQALLRIRHSNVVALLDAGNDGGVPFLVLEHVDGEPLSARLEREGPFSPRAAAELVRCLAAGLEHCHARGVLHRDVKPENVLLRASSLEPVLVDFGLARQEEDHLSRSALTAEGTLLGTPGYWAPEQARGDLAAIGPRTDVFGLGGLLHALLTGEPPHRGATMGELLAAMAREPEPPSRTRRDVPGGLDAIALRCLARRPESRFASAAAVEAALRAWLEGRRGVGWRRAVALLALLSLAAAGGWLVRAQRGEASLVAPVPSASVSSSSHTQGPAPGPTTAARLWSERLAHASEPTLRPDAYAWLRYRGPGEAAEQLLQAGREIPPEQLAEIQDAARLGLPQAQLHLALIELRRGDPAARQAALELLWKGSREPQPSVGAGLQLARILALEGAPDAARFLLREAEGRNPPARWSTDETLAAGRAWLVMAGPGELARGLECLRHSQGGMWAGDVAGPREPVWGLLDALARYEGWGCASQAEALPEIVQALNGPAAPAARSWLEHAALVGEPRARAVLELHSWPIPDPSTLDPRDLLAFDGSCAVQHPNDAVELSILHRRRFDASPSELRQLALRGLTRAAHDLGLRALMAGELRPALCWSALAAIRGPEHLGLAVGRLSVGRALFFGEGCDEDPRAGVRWLASVGERGDALDNIVAEAELWLGLAQRMGRGMPQDVEAGTARMRHAMEATVRYKEVWGPVERAVLAHPWAGHPIADVALDGGSPLRIAENNGEAWAQRVCQVLDNARR